jgi:RNA binding exosome subunit
MTRFVNEFFSSAEISIIIHATEDKHKILKSLEDTLSIPSNSFFVGVAHGHWQNQILLLTSRLNKKQASELYSKVHILVGGQEPMVKNLFDEKGNLYIRLDKQKLCKGKLVLSERDSVRIKFKAMVREKSEAWTLDSRRNRC